MKHEQTTGRGINRRTYLKMVSVGALTTGLAGCLGVEAEDSSTPNADGENTTAGAGAQGSGTETDASTDAGEDDGSGEPATMSSANGDTTTDGTDAAQLNERESTNECIDAGTVDTSGFETYTNSEDSYSIDHPADWSVFEDSEGKSVALEGKAGLEHVDVMIKTADGQTADEFAVAYVESSGEDAEVLCQTEMTLPSGQTGTFTEYEIVADQAGVVGGGEVLHVVENGAVYQVETTSIAGSDQETDQLLKTIVRSFTLEEDN